jgi:DNA mismatch repair ATPase MutS
MLRKINKTLNPEAQMYGGSKQHFNRLYSVQPNQNEMLDTLRNLYAELVDKIRDIVAEFSVQTQLPLRMSHTVAFGFHIQLVLTGHDVNYKVPDALEELQRRGKLYYLTTKEVAGLNHRINKLADEIQIVSNS